MKSKIINLYKKLLDLSFCKLLFFNYAIVWVGLIISLLIGKIVYYITPYITNTVTHYVTMRVEAVGSVGDMVTQNPLFQASILYFLNNFLTALLIIVFFMIFTRSKSDDEYFTSCVVFYLLCVIMPMSGIIGGNLPLKGMYAIIPHGLFELFAIALSITIGMKYSYKYYKTRSVNLKPIPVIVFIIGLLLITAGLFEPIDWSLYFHSQITNQSLLDLMLKYYIGI